MGSGIVFVVIVGLWAVVLIPMWLRNHDAAVESKSVDRFSTAMRTLSRRSGSGPDSREVLMPGRATRAEVSGGRAPAAASRRARAAAQQQMRRRRTLVLGLTGFLVVVGVAAFAGLAPIWLPVVVLLGTGGYAANLRVQAVRAREMARRERRRRPVPAERRAPAPVPPIWPVTATSGVAYRPARQASVDVPLVAPVEADGAWTAIDVILPTYVTAPPATSVPRVIDLTSPGSWSAAHMLEHAAAAGQPDPDEIFDRLADDEVVAEHEAVAETVAGSTSRPFLEDDAVFDQEDEDTLMALLDRRAVND